MAGLKAEAVDLLVTLIRNACVNDGTEDSGHEHRSVATLQNFLDAPGQVFEPHPGRQSVVYRVPGSHAGAPALALLTHLDVVPAGDQGWEHDPFGGERTDGFVWGRGAVDMLNMAASMATAFRPYLNAEVTTLRANIADMPNARSPSAAALWQHCGHVITGFFVGLICLYYHQKRCIKLNILVI